LSDDFRKQQTEIRPWEIKNLQNYVEWWIVQRCWSFFWPC
jgi:hypothetical protein